jgi:hypothetical protein
VQGIAGHGWRLALVAMAITLAWARPAAADPWRPVAQACNTAAASPGCSTLRASTGIWHIAISPDGRNAYGLAWNTHALIIFDRDPGSGALTQRGAGGCLSEDGSGGACVKAKGLFQPVSIAISPDGRSVYVGSHRTTPDGDAYVGGGVAMFARNPTTGDLSQPADATACVSYNTATGGAPTTPGACAKGRGMTLVSAIAVSPDGRHVYTAGHSIAVLERNPTTGVLTQPAGETGCVQDVAGEGCAPARAMRGDMRQIAISPDGRSLYAPNFDPTVGNSVAIFDREAGSGRLVQKSGTAGCVAVNGGGVCNVESKLTGARAAVVSPDGNQVYVSANNAMLVFGRAGDGQLALQSCVSDPSVTGCAHGRNLSSLTFNAVSPDGQTVVASNEASGLGFVIFERDGAGNLTQPATADGCVTPGGNAWVSGEAVPGACHAFGTQWGHGTMSFFGDGSLTVASHYGGSVTAFKRDFYPGCQSTDATLAQNTPTPVGLSCGDRNGDPLTYEILRQPVSGTLGGIDQGGGRVTYDPFTNFLGGDTLTYRAVSNGMASDEATLRLNVVAPPVPTPRPRTVTSPVTYNWSVKRTRFTLRQLVVRRLPVGSTVTLTCTGKRCKFKTRTIKRSRKSTMNVLNAKTLKGRKTFRAGQTVDIRIAAPGMNGKVLRFKLKSGKVPKHRTYCQPLGSKRAYRTCP